MSIFIWSISEKRLVRLNGVEMDMKGASIKFRMLTESNLAKIKVNLS